MTAAHHSSRRYTLADRLIQQIDNGLRTVFGKVDVSERANPAEAENEADLTPSERELSGRLMRINHAGEVSAQGLYQGQALTAKLPDVREKMQRAALEENDHLAWCEQRLKQLGTHTSVLGPFWYANSFAMGALAGALGDKWSLGFVVETEHQVVKHLDSHLAQVAENDKPTSAILKQMKIDEAHHATTALHAGGAPLPAPVKSLMRLTSRVMTRSAYWV